VYTPTPIQPASAPPPYAPQQQQQQPAAYTPPPIQPAFAPPPPSPAPRRPAQPGTGQLVDTLTRLVLESWRGYPLEEETLSLLQVGLPYLAQRDCSKDAILAGQTAARLGYIARAAEYAEYPPARESDEDLAEELLESLEAEGKGGESMAGGMAEFAADLAMSEPVDPPPSDGGPSWSLPGLDGSLRGRLRDQLLKGVSCPADISRQDLQQTWKYGYFLRCTEEFFFDG